MTDEDCIEKLIEKLNEIALEAEGEEIKFRAELKEMGIEDILDKPIYHPPPFWFLPRE